MRHAGLEAELSELSSAEEFLQFFDIAYEPRVVMVNRLHILQRFHDYLEAEAPAGGESWRDHYARLLARAYGDFVASDARTEKVFKVFRDRAKAPAFVPLGDLVAAPESENGTP